MNLTYLIIFIIMIYFIINKNSRTIQIGGLFSRANRTFVAGKGGINDIAEAGLKHSDQAIGAAAALSIRNGEFALETAVKIATNAQKNLDLLKNVAHKAGDEIAEMARKKAIDNAQKAADRAKKHLNDLRDIRSKVNPKLYQDVVKAGLDYNKIIKSTDAMTKDVADNIRDTITKELKEQISTSVKKSLMEGIEDGAKMSDALAKHIDDVTSEILDDIVTNAVRENIQRSMLEPSFIKLISATGKNADIFHDEAKKLIAKLATNSGHAAAAKSVKTIGSDILEGVSMRLKIASNVSQEMIDDFAKMRKIADSKVDDAISKLDDITEDALLAKAHKAFPYRLPAPTNRMAQNTTACLEFLRKEKGVTTMLEARKIASEMAATGNKMWIDTFETLTREFAQTAGMAKKLKKLQGRAREQLLRKLDDAAMGKVWNRMSIDDFQKNLAKNMGDKRLIENSVDLLGNLKFDDAIRKNMDEVIDKKIKEFIDETVEGIAKKSHSHTVRNILAVGAILIFGLTILLSTLLGGVTDETHTDGKCAKDDFACMIQQILKGEDDGILPQGTGYEFLITTYEAQLAMVEAGTLPMVDPALQAIINCLENPNKTEMDLSGFVSNPPTLTFEGFAKDLDKYGCAAYKDPKNPIGDSDDLCGTGSACSGGDGADGGASGAGGAGAGGKDKKDDGPGFTENMFSKEWFSNWWWVVAIAVLVVMMIGAVVVVMIMGGGESGVEGGESGGQVNNSSSYPY